MQQSLAAGLVFLLDLSARLAALNKMRPGTASLQGGLRWMVLSSHGVLLKHPVFVFLFFA